MENQVTKDNIGQLVKANVNKPILGILYDVDDAGMAIIGKLHDDKLNKLSGQFGSGSKTIHVSHLNLIF